MNVLFSSTLPNAFDTAGIAEAKLLQIAQGDGMAVEVGGTVTYSTSELESADTEVSILEKLLQVGIAGAAADAPPIVGGQQYLQSDDGTWHLVDLEIVGGINLSRVIQDDVASPGAQYLGYVVLIASDVTKHKLSLVNYGGAHVLQLHQETTPAPGVSGITLISSDSNSYVLSAVLDGAVYEVAIEQPA